MIVRETQWDDATAVALRLQQRAEIDLRYGRPNSETGLAPTGEDIAVFFIAVDDSGVGIGCGGLRAIKGFDGASSAEGEIKRMFVAPEHRGTGVATAILDSLEQYARARGWFRLVLETGDRQSDALRFYDREGYARIPNFGYYVGSRISVCFEKILFLSDPSDDTNCDGCQ